MGGRERAPRLPVAWCARPARLRQPRSARRAGRSRCADGAGRADHHGARRAVARERRGAGQAAGLARPALGWPAHRRARARRLAGGLRHDRHAARKQGCGVRRDAGDDAARVGRRARRSLGPDPGAPACAARRAVRRPGARCVRARRDARRRLGRAVLRVRDARRGDRVSSAGVGRGRPAGAPADRRRALLLPRPRRRRDRRRLPRALLRAAVLRARASGHADHARAAARGDRPAVRGRLRRPHPVPCSGDLRQVDLLSEAVTRAPARVRVG